MKKAAFVVIDLQNDITKHYKEIIGNVNAGIEWAVAQGMPVCYIKHHNLSAATRTFKPDTQGAELVADLKIVSESVFTKTKGNALTSEAFAAFVKEQQIETFYVTGADATACVKSTCYNMAKGGYDVHVLSDCITSYDLRKIPEMLAYYRDKGCIVQTLSEAISKLSSNVSSLVGCTNW